MAWTFDAADPYGSDKDHVRVLIGDTDTTRQLISDEVINGEITLLGSGKPHRVAIAVARRALALMARDPDERTAIGITTKRAKAGWQAVLKELKKETASKAGGLVVKGVSKDARDDLEDESDFIKPRFTTRRDRNGR